MTKHNEGNLEEEMSSFIGKKVRVTHEGSIFLPVEGICRDVYVDPPGQNENFEMLLEDGSFFWIIPDIFGGDFIEGLIHKARGRRRIEIIE